jgi:predicted nucleic acid-binding protein
MAEVYATMTALPLKPAMPPEQALLFVEEIRDRLTTVTLDSDEYFDALQTSADRGLSSGRVYDALLLRCAAKVKARTIYTFNVRHFQAIAPELADRIRTP